MKKLLKNIILTLLNPISPIITLFIGWLLTILITQPNESFPYIINYTIKNPIIVMAFIVFWLISSIIYTELQNRITKLKQDVLLKDEIIKQKESQLIHTAGIVLNRSGDFANFNKILRFNDALKGFTENNTIVECVQMYSYSTKRVNDKVIIKVMYDSSYCSDGIDINNLSQCHYEINYNDYNTLKNIISIWKKLSNDAYISFVEKDSLINFLVKGIQNIYKKYYNDLQEIKDISEINNIHFTQYRILTLLSRLARRKSITMFDGNHILGSDKDNNNDIDKANKKAEIENYLLNGKRTGILNSILLEDIFMFKYTRNSHKKDGRAYISFPVTITMQNYICIFSIQISDLDENIDLKHEIKSLRDDLTKRFEKSSVFLS